MRPEEFYLRDIILACKSAIDFVGSISREFFNASDLYQSAVLFKLMIIGEAASQISPHLKSRHTHVDWQSLKGFRNIIAHEYFSLNQDIVWNSATDDAVILIPQIIDILSTEVPEFPLPSEWK